ncbi:hypothetical protein [Kordia sp.]|uniref:hypothetical protein n=1 Tax=Kordia sp. TaxID=1965332 RepID=UPI003D2B29A7
MKLTKDEIQTIDEYLQRSGVSYWDVRIELLDHFIEAIEEKIATTELSFDEALMEVTVAFGNDIQERHLLNRDKTVVLFSGIFSNNKGFKELEEEKRRQNRKQYVQLLIKKLKENFFSLRFYTEYLCFILMTYVVFQYDTKWGLVAAGIWLTIEIFKTLMTTKKHKKFAQDSLRGEMSSKVISVFFGISIHTFAFIFTTPGLESKNIFWFLLPMLLFYPIIKASLSIHKKIYTQYKKYKELISV